MSALPVRAYQPNDWKLMREGMKMLKPAYSVLDVGAGIRPQRILTAARHVCMEPHGEYADVLESNGYEVIRADALTGLKSCEQFDTVIAMDVIEHMTKGDGAAFLKLAQERARQQVVVFTPYGFQKQDGGKEADPWGMQGQKWQEHRSGWVPDEFGSGWKTLADRGFHGPKGGAIFAVWTR